MSVLLFLFFGGAWAQETKAPSPTPTTAEKTQIALVQGDGATVYAQPDFDSKVLITLKSGQKLRVTQKTVPGPGGFGSFYKVLFKHERFGFVSDVEVVPEYTRVGKRQRTQKNPDYEDYENRKTERDPIFFTRYIGPSFGMVDYSEKISGQSFRSSSFVFGLKMTGPGVLFDGPPIDFNLFLHVGAPSYLKGLANGGTASGFFILSDISILFPLLEGRNNLLTIGAGPMFVYTNFKATFNTPIQPYFLDIQEFRIGASFLGAYTHRMGRYAVRFEGKYYLEKTQYFGGNGSLQVEF